MDAVVSLANDVASRVSTTDALVTDELRDLAALESALEQGLLEDWRRTIDADPHATLYQSPGWCIPWYRGFERAYSPYLIVVRVGGLVVGLVPMAVDRQTGELAFASNAMADYRDIVALPAYRTRVVEALVRCYLAGGFANPLQVGWTDPASDTPAILSEICTRYRLPVTVRRQPCHRWFPPAPAKPSAQKFLNWYKRNGTVSFDVVDSEPAWQRFREEYYRQHSLRQIQAGRQLAFDDERKAELYEALFHSPDVQCHVTAFSHNGRMLAGHFGYVWRGVLLLGPPSIRLEDEQRSPAVILLSWIIQNAERLGLAGFDLTIGESDFKKRLGNQCVDLTMIEVHGRRRAYYAQAARDKAINLAKRAVERAGGPDTWKNIVKPAADAFAFEAARLKELSAAEAVARVGRSARCLVYDARVECTYALTPETLVTPALAGEFTLRENSIEDLLQWRGSSVSVAHAMTSCARGYARSRALGHVLHTLLRGSSLAGWCFSSASGIHDAVVLSEYRRTDAAATLLAEAARYQFAHGARELRLTLPGVDTMMRPAAAANGKLVGETRTPRLFGSERLYDRGSRLWRRLTWRAVRRRVDMAVRFKAEEQTYRLSPEQAAELPSSPDFSRDRWEELDRFIPTEPRHSRDEVLADWRARRARGEHVYTRLEDGRLAAYGWVVERQRTMPLTWVDHSVELPEGTAVLYDFYTLPEYRHRDFYQRLLMHAAQDAAQMAGTRWVYLSILASDTVPRFWVERMGMELVGTYGYERTLFWRRKWQRPSATGATA